MFSIDLLKGKGMVAKGGMKATMLKVVPFLIPLIAMAAWAASYQQDSATIRAQKAEIRKNQAVIDESGKAIEAYRNANVQINKMKTCLATIAKSLSCRIQVTDLLMEMTESLPDEIFFYEINLDRTEIMQKNADSDAKDKSRRIVQRKLKVTVCGFDPVESDRMVREYVNHLKTSEVLAAIFLDVKSAARRQGVVDQKPATYYEIECVLREQG